MRLNEQQIKEINSKCPYNQGIFVQPYGIPENVKEPVIYQRYELGGYSGGNCWGDEAQPYTADPPENWVVFDYVFELIKPEITYLQFRKVENQVKKLSDSQWEYYGNSTSYEVKYIPLSEVYKIVGI